jgi:hypothetical protein
VAAILYQTLAWQIMAGNQTGPKSVLVGATAGCYGCTLKYLEIYDYITICN